VFRRLSDDPPARRPWYFISLRWRAIWPLAIMALLLAMAGAYVIGGAAARGAQDREIAHVLDTSRAVADRMAPLGENHRREIMRFAFTQGVADQLLDGNAIALHLLLEPLAVAADLDYLIVTDANGREVVGLQRVATAGGVDYAVASGTDLASIVADQPTLLDYGTGTRVALVRAGQGYALMTAGPIMRVDEQIGTVIVGIRIERVIAALRGGDAADLAIYGAGGEFVRTTLPFTDTTRDALALAPETFQQALTSPGQVPVASLTLDGTPYNVAYIPFVVDGMPLGVVAAFRVDDTLYGTFLSRELTGMLAAALVGAVIVLTFVVIGRFAGRLERVTATAHALAAGDARARTRMRAGDEIGELGATLDRLAERQQHRTDSMQATLRQQRADTARLSAVLESIPDGLVAQDLDGRVLLINDAARELLGGQRAFRSARLHELTAVVTEKLGPALAPGIYALGDPTRIPLDDKVLQAQAAAITIRPNQQRIGTVIVLRDITPDVTREQRREDLLEKLSEQALAPRGPQVYGSLSALAQEVARNARAIQSVIAELRDLSAFEPRDLQAGQQPLAVNDLLWHIGAEWEPLAAAANARLRVKFGPRGRYVLGDDRRLRWAVGNVVDNALKYSPPGATITISARARRQSAEIIVEDEGYGIAPPDLEKAFARFYRGTPRDRNGHPVRTPGTGQGLFIARRVIEAHGGEISLASRVGAGTTAVFRLPLTSEVTLEMPPESAPAAPAAEELPLADGPYATVPLARRAYPWERGK
jgi:PAS domain S-box-containing protein